MKIASIIAGSVCGPNYAWGFCNSGATARNFGDRSSWARTCVVCNGADDCALFLWTLVT